MDSYGFALCMWFLMLACFLSGFGQSCIDTLRGRPASFFKYGKYWVINALTCSRGLWAILQVAFFSKWFSVAKFAFPEGLGWLNGYFWVCVICVVITLNQLARLRFPSPAEIHLTADGTDEELVNQPVRLKNLNLFARIGFIGGLAMFVCAAIVFFWH